MNDRSPSAAAALEPPRPGEAPAAFERRLLDAASRLTSPCGRGEMVWRRWGDRRAVPLVLLHGGFGSWRHFALNVGALSARYCVHAADLPGLGDSAPLDAEYSATNIAAAVCDGIERVLPPRCEFHLCGFSFGGIIAGPVAAAMGERVLSYTGVAPGGLGLPFGPRPELMSPRPKMSEAELREVHRHNLGTLMIHDPGRVDDLAVHLQTETVRRARARSGAIPTSTVLAEHLPHLSPRTRVNAVWGAHDAIAGEFIAPRRRLFESLPHEGEFTVIARAGHWVMYERPEAFERTLLRLLSAA